MSYIRIYRVPQKVDSQHLRSAFFFSLRVPSVEKCPWSCVEAKEWNSSIVAERQYMTFSILDIIL